MSVIAIASAAAKSLRLVRSKQDRLFNSVLTVLPKSAPERFRGGGLVRGHTFCESLRNFVLGFSAFLISRQFALCLGMAERSEVSRCLSLPGA